MELILTALIKAIILYWGGVAVLVMNNSKLIKSQANSKFTCPPPPPTFHVTIDPLSTVFFIFMHALWVCFHHNTLHCLP